MRSLQNWPAAVSFLFAVVAAATVSAQAIDPPRLFQDLDANADGVLTSEEAGADHARLFSRLIRLGDESGDGQLSTDEFSTGLTPVRSDKEMVQKQGNRLPGSDALIVLLAKVDDNQDLALEADEVPEQFRGVFQAMVARGDADKNGRLDRREIAEGGPQLAVIAGAFAARMRMDVAAELAQLPQARRQAFERLSALPMLMQMPMGDQVPGRQRGAAVELFALLDADGDATVSADDAAEGIANLVRRGDRDGDGKLSSAEFFAIGRGSAEPAAPSPQADPATVRNRVRQLLATLDRDGDGQLSREELPPPMARAFQRVDADRSGAVDADELQDFIAGRGEMRGQRRTRPGAAPDKQQQ